MNTSVAKWKMAGVIWKVGKWVTIATVFVPAVILILLLVIGLFLNKPPATLAQASPALHFENNYRPGTEAYAITKVATDTFPTLDIVLSDLRFQSQMTDKGRAGHPDSAVRMLQAVGHQNLGTFKDRVRKPVGSMGWDNELFKINACVIFLPENPLKRGVVAVAGTVLHEAIHCSDGNTAFALKERYVWLKDYMLSRNTDLSKAAAGARGLQNLNTVIAEAFVTAMLRSLSFTQGTTGKLADMKYNEVLRSANGGVLVIASTNVALVIEKLCSRQGDCPTTTPELLEFLHTNDTYIQALGKDAMRWQELDTKHRM